MINTFLPILCFYEVNTSVISNDIMKGVNINLADVSDVSWKVLCHYGHARLLYVRRLQVVICMYHGSPAGHFSSPWFQRSALNRSNPGISLPLSDGFCLMLVDVCTRTNTQSQATGPLIHSCFHLEWSSTDIQSRWVILCILLSVSTGPPSVEIMGW